MFYKQHGLGSPTVVMDAGLGDTSSTWDPVTPGIAAFTSALAYDRPGLGASPPTLLPRTSGHMVEELHDLLSSVNIKPPYVMLGHSFGGLNALLYAATYPGDVAGIVMLDTPPPGWVTLLEKLLTPDQMEIYRDGYTNNREGVYFAERKQSDDQAYSVSRLPDLPLIVLAQAGPFKWSPDRPAEQLERGLLDLQTRLAGLSSQGSLRFVSDAGHYIHHDRPQLVVDAVLEVVEEIRAIPRTI